MSSYIAVLFLENISTIIIAVLIFLILRWMTRRPANFPPGPWALPLIGTLSVLRKNPEKIFPQLRKKYGDVFTVYMGTKPYIVVGGMDRIREMLVKYAYATSGRPKSLLSDILVKGKGLLSLGGKVFKEQRTFTVAKLRAFGMGKMSLEGRVLEEVETFVKYVRGFGGEPVQLHHHVFSSVCNVILGVTAGKRYRHDDPELLKLLHATKENFRLLSHSGILSIFPWLIHLPGDMFGFKTVIRNLDTDLKIIGSYITEHKKDFRPDNIRDFIDVYLAEIEAKKHDPDTTFKEDQLLYLVVDLIVGGSETTATTIDWGILFLALNPEIQRKIQVELDDVVGSMRYPSLTDKPNLPYTEATIMEIQRKANLGLFVPPHCTTEHIKVYGYDIPEDTTLLFMLGETFSDPELWKNPEVFNPERFLMDGKVAHIDRFPAFGWGKRACPGEALAKMELFLFFTGLLQNFTFEFPADLPTPTTERVLGFTVAPRPYSVCAVPR